MALESVEATLGIRLCVSYFLSILSDFHPRENHTRKITRLKSWVICKNSLLDNKIYSSIVHKKAIWNLDIWLFLLWEKMWENWEEIRNTWSEPWGWFFARIWSWQISESFVLFWIETQFGSWWNFRDFWWRRLKKRKTYFLNFPVGY